MFILSFRANLVAFGPPPAAGPVQFAPRTGEPDTWHVIRREQCELTVRFAEQPPKWQAIILPRTRVFLSARRGELPSGNRTF